MAEMNTVAEITARIETGVKELFESEKYKDYLKTMSRFHRYSARNIMLIHLQRPDATHVAGYQAWINKFKRQVRRGEKGIKILAPAPIIIKQETEVIDPLTKKPIIGENGQPLQEEIEIKTARFKVANVFDVSQTDGEPLPTLAETLTGDVERFDMFMDTLKAISALPIEFIPMPEDTDGLCDFTDKKITIREGMSQIQTVSAVIHEIAHAKLHDIETLRLADADVKPKDRRTEEVEAESVSYSVAQYYGIETGTNSFGYLATWSKERELKELNASLETIRKTVAELIDNIDEKYKALAKERGIDLTTDGTYVKQDDVSIAVEVANNEENTSQCRQLYDKLSGMFPVFFDRNYKELHLESEGSLPLTLKWYSDGYTIAVMHSFVHDDEVHYNPKIVFDIDYVSTVRNDFKALTPVEYERSDPYLYQVYDADGRWLSYDEDDNTTAIFGLHDSITTYALQWIDEIAERGYIPVKAIAKTGGKEETLDLREATSPVTAESKTQIAEHENIILPDQSVTIMEMYEFGYTSEFVLPLSRELAIELFNSGENVYLLYSDNTEVFAFDIEELKLHDGFFGIEYTDWEAILNFKEAMYAVENSEGSKEAMLIYGKESQFGIYQIPDGIDENRDFRFMNMDFLNSQGLTVNRENYELVYSAPLKVSKTSRNLSEIYTNFQGENARRPEDYMARSPSVSDVIVLQQNGEVTAHFVDSFGFKTLPSFTGYEKHPETVLQETNQPSDIVNPETGSQTLTVADLKAEVDEGKAISLSDLARAVQAEGNQTIAKKPSLLGALERNKQRVAHIEQSNTQKINEAEVTK